MWSFLKETAIFTLWTLAFTVGPVIALQAVLNRVFSMVGRGL